MSIEVIEVLRRIEQQVTRVVQGLPRRELLERRYAGNQEGKTVTVAANGQEQLSPGSYVAVAPFTPLTFTDGIAQIWNLTNDGSPFSLITPTILANSGSTPATFRYFPHIAERGILLSGSTVNPDGGGNFTLRNILPGYWSVVAIDGAGHSTQIDQGRTAITLVLAAGDVPVGTIACIMRLRAML